MVETAAVPVTVKCRLGVDDLDSYEALARFVEAIARAGSHTVIVHARKALLAGLSPAKNRSVPPLDYARVHRLKSDFPALEVVLNGGLDRLPAIVAHAQTLDGVMVGRAAYHDPWLLAEAEAALFGTPLPASRHAILKAVRAQIAVHLAAGGRLHDVTRHVLGFFRGQPGARQFRRHLSEHAHRTGAGLDVFDDALAYVGSGREWHRCSSG
jgi:tRNA-dihydrouridine synthase A